MNDGFFTKTHDTNDLIPNTPDPAFTGMVPTVSFSGMSKFETCPYALFLDKVSQVGSVGSTAMDRGSLLHELLESYINGDINELPWSKFKSGDYHADLIEALREDKIKGLCHPEYILAVTVDMKETTWDAPDVWLRGAIDILNYHDESEQLAIVLDWKSGNNQSTAKHRSQLMLYCLVLFILKPDLQAIRAAPVYLDHKEELFYTEFTRADVDLLWERYYQRLRAVTDAREFLPNPNAFTCRWCQHKAIQPTLNQTEPACKFAHRG